ncbi:MAG: FAD-dependent oxidoreductase [Myxococcaceae bacterium]|nr:FAD-dependent oxidoreductase [Myxococcaceae bacterium]
MSGLATAAALGRGASLAIIERDGEPGGYCKTVKQDGFVWDYSGHFFHFKHAEIEAWLRERMVGQEIRTVAKKSFIRIGGKLVDFPFQKNIHQLPQADFIDCLHDLYFAKPDPADTSFKGMLYGRFGRGICERFLIPYNEKLYATDLGKLDRDAMGRFFPHADVADIIRNMKQPDNATYNATFTYPRGGAIEYVKALLTEVEPSALKLSEALVKIDLEKKVATTTKGTYRYQRLVSSAPFPTLLELCGRGTPDGYSWNQVQVFNLGFDAKGPRDVHWVYYPERDVPFYRIGFYDNIFDGDRMSLYVEVGLTREGKGAATLEQVIEALRRDGTVTTQKLVSHHSVIMNPAYVHITSDSNAKVSAGRAELAKHGVFSLGRYGGWTYCSIEDNIVEARALVASLKQ